MNIIFEGIDGVGKTTIIKELEKDLKQKGELVRFIDELTEDSPITETLTQMLSVNPFFSLNQGFPTAAYESLLLAADLHYRQERYRYSDGFNLYDRDFLSILNYQREILKEDYPTNYMDFYEPFKKIVMFNLKPVDLLVYVHTPIEVSLERASIRDQKEFLEKQKSFLLTLKQAYETELIPELEHQKVKVLKLDGRNDKKDNVKEIYRGVGYGKD